MHIEYRQYGRPGLYNFDAFRENDATADPFFTGRLWRVDGAPAKAQWVARTAEGDDRAVYASGATRPAAVRALVDKVFAGAWGVA